MKRILLLMDAPGPPLYAPRMRYLVTNLAKQGWQWVVISEHMPGCDFTFEHCTHLQFSYYNKRYSSLHNKILWLTDKLFNTKEKAFYKFITKHIQPSHFDYILCSAFHTFPLPTAARLAKKWNLPLVADLRDIAEQWGDTPYMQHPVHTPWKSLNTWLTDCYTHLSIRQRNRALHTASHITTVSPWHMHTLQQIHPSIHLIYNGYDESAFTPQDVRSEDFTITYTGRIYDFNLRDPHLLFEALSQLQTENRLPEKLRVTFFCEDNIHSQLNNLVAHHKLTSVIHVKSFVPNSEIINLLRQTSVCLILTNKASEKGQHGIMTTKFFEALGVEKPVLCIPSDEECLAQVIHETNAGIATSDTEQIKDFILSKYAEWLANGFTRQPVNLQQKQRFTRQYQAGQFQQILFSLPTHTHD